MSGFESKCKQSDTAVLEAKMGRGWVLLLGFVSALPLVEPRHTYSGGNGKSSDTVNTIVERLKKDKHFSVAFRSDHTNLNRTFGTMNRYLREMRTLR